MIDPEREAARAAGLCGAEVFHEGKVHFCGLRAGHGPGCGAKMLTTREPARYVLDSPVTPVNP